MTATTSSTSTTTESTNQPVTLASLLRAGDVTSERLAAHLDALSSDERIAQCRALGKSQLARLWEVAGGGTALAPEDFVSGVTDGKPVAFAGKNSLAAFTHFEKHFVRHDGALVGINVQSMSFATGPGYFTVLPGGGDGHQREVLFDYTQVPATLPAAGWPTVKDNAGGLRKLVYGGMHDFNRRVSRDVVIGAATRLGKPIGQYYVLARKAG